MPSVLGMHMQATEKDGDSLARNCMHMGVWTVWCWAWQGRPLGDAAGVAACLPARPPCLLPVPSTCHHPAAQFPTPSPLQWTASDQGRNVVYGTEDEDYSTGECVHGLRQWGSSGALLE